MNFNRIVLCLVLYCSCLASSAQQFGGNPPSLKWKQLNTDTVRLIFPAHWKGNPYELAAQAAALGSTQATLGKRFRKINIVLQTGPTYSNAYVGLGPRRSEFFMTPPQNSFELGSLYWPEQLLIHEFRHVQQYNNFNKGISSLFYVMAGELGMSFINSTAIPNWFWEGDAVYQETLVSTQGRGRVPFFFNGYRSLWASGKNYSWLKLRNGSLRDYVPDHYQLGYLLVAYGREKYGDSIWARVTDDAVRFKGLFYPFQHAVKKQTGTSFRNFRQAALNYFKEQDQLQADPVAAAAGKQRHFTGDEEYPVFTAPDQLLFVKSSYSRIPGFYTRDLATGKDQLIRVKDISLDNYFSYRNGTIVYSGLANDRRWGWQEYAEIRLLDVQTGEQKKLTTKTRYFSPDINDSGTVIVAAQFLPDGSSALHLLDAGNGQLLKPLPNPSAHFYTYPKFFGQNAVVTAVRNRAGEMALLRVNCTTGKEEQLLPFSLAILGVPVVKGDSVLITASFEGKEQLFLIAANRLFRIQTPVPNRATGNYQLSWSGDQLAWVSFTSAGYKVYTGAAAAAAIQEMQPSALGKNIPVFGVQKLQSAVPMPGLVTAKTAAVKPYSKWHGLFNFHSWLPTISSTEYALSFIGENVINTLQSDLTVTYNVNDKSKKISYTGAYGALYPWIRLGGAFTKDRQASYNNETVYWNEAELRGGLLVPLNFTRGRTFTNLRIGSDYIYAKPSFQAKFKDSFDSHGYGYLNTYLTFTNQSQIARQHIYPRFAQQIRLEHYNAITYLKANQFLANANWYFPGLFRNHSLVLGTAIHQRDTANQLRFTNNFPFARGYTERNYHRMLKFSADYHLPLCYPDWGLASIVYFQRVRADLFYDYSRIQDYNQNRQLVTRELRTAGATVFFDTKWWNQQPISFGIRYSRLLDAAAQGGTTDVIEFVLPVSLIGR